MHNLRMYVVHKKIRTVININFYDLITKTLITYNVIHLYKCRYFVSTFTYIYLLIYVLTCINK